MKQETREAIVIAKEILIEDIILNLTPEQITQIMRKIGLWDENKYVAQWTPFCLNEAYLFACDRRNALKVSIGVGNDYYILVTRSPETNGDCTVVGFHEELEELEQRIRAKDAARIVLSSKENLEFLFGLLGKDVQEAVNNNPFGKVTDFYNNIKGAVGEDRVEELSQTYSFTELVLLSPERICEDVIGYSWEAFGDGGSYKAKSPTLFRTRKEAYEDMRQAALDKMKWNTEYDEDFGGDDDQMVEYGVSFSRGKIVHNSFSGRYAWHVVKVFRDEEKDYSPHKGCSYDEALLFIATYALKVFFNTGVTLDGWDGETCIIEALAEEFYSAMRENTWENETIYDAAQKFLEERVRAMEEDRSLYGSHRRS